MSAPSFLFSALDEETLKLTDELNFLGGGDATVRNVNLYALIGNQSGAENSSQVLFEYGKSVGFRDVLLPRNIPSEKNMKYFPVTSATVGSGNLKYTSIAKQLTDWMEQGFNGSLLSMGARGSGKTAALFADHGCRNHRSTNEVTCLADTVFCELFSPVSDSNCHRTIAISAYVLQDQRIVDLLTSSSTPSSRRSPLDFACVECPDLSTALKVLHEARRRAPGALVHEGNGSSFLEKDRCHFFLRILLHTTTSSSSDNNSDNVFRDCGILSTLLIADLLGTANTDDDRVFAHLSEEERVAVRANNQQLSSLCKVLNEMATTSRSAATGHHSRGSAAAADGPLPSLIRMTSARDAKLSTLLAPVLQGNAHCSVAMFLRDGEKHAQEARQLLTATSGWMDITSACFRVKDVTLRSLNLKRHDSVLSITHINQHQHEHQSSTFSSHSSRSRQYNSSDNHSVSLASDSQDLQDMDLSRVLADDYHPRGTGSTEGRNNQHQLGSQNDVRFDTAQINNEGTTHIDTHHLRDKDVSRTMDAFHDLMHSLNNTSVVSRPTPEETPLSSSSSSSSSTRDEQHSTPPTQFLPKTRESDWTQPVLDINHYLPPPPEKSQYNAKESSVRHIPSSTSSDKKQTGSGRYSSALSANDEAETEQREEIDLNRCHDHSTAFVSTVNRSEFSDVTSALRELQRSASTQDQALIEAEINRLTDEMDSGAVPRPTKSTARVPVSVEYFPKDSEARDFKSYRYNNRVSASEQYDEDEDNYLVNSRRPVQSEKERYQKGSVESHRTSTVSFADDYLLEDEELNDSLDFATHKLKREGQERTAINKDDAAQWRDHSERATTRDVRPALQSIENKKEHSSMFSHLDASGGYQSIDSTSPLVSYSDIFQEKLRTMSEVQRRSDEQYAAHSNDAKSQSNSGSQSEGWHQAHTAQILADINRQSTDKQIQSDDFPQAQNQQNTAHTSSMSDNVAHSIQTGLLPTRWSLDAAPSLSTLMFDPAIADGTIDQTAQDVPETERLRRANSSLMEALREERALRVRTEKELSVAKDALLEVRTQCDVDLDSSAIEIKQLKNQLRALCDNHSLTDVFATFEESVARLTRENGILRRQNQELEVREMDMLEHGDKYVGSKTNETISSRSNQEKHRILSKLRKSGQERENLKEQFEALKAKERQFLLSGKLAQDASRRLRISHQDLLRTKKELESERLAHADTERDLRLIRQDTLELKQSESHLREERARTVHELALLRERVATLDDERRRNGQLSKFITKHSADESQNIKQTNHMISAGGTKRGYMGERMPVNNAIAASRPHTTNRSKNINIASHFDESEPLLNIPVMYDRSSTDRHALAPTAVQGMAGLSNARYSRPEETTVASADLETLLSSMHESIIATQPSLLPTFRRLSQQIHVDRTRALEQRAKLLEMAFPTSVNTPVKVDSAAPQRSFGGRHAAMPTAVAKNSNKFVH